MGKIFCLIGKTASGVEVVLRNILIQMPHLYELKEKITETEEIDLKGNNYIIIAEPQDIEILRKKYRKNVVIIMIEVDDGIRLMRMLTREMTESTYDYGGVCREFLLQEEIFKGVRPDYTCPNVDVLQCVENICSLIRRARSDK